MKITLKVTTRLLALPLAWALASAPAMAQLTEISPIPLARSTGSVLPNMLFTLDASGSMQWEYIPDYVTDSRQCMTRSGDNTDCAHGDPVFFAGGKNGSNGVAYDPNYTYKPAVRADGTPLLSEPLTPTAVPMDAFGVQTYAFITNYPTGGNFTPTPSNALNLTTGVPDLRYCNSQSVCKRNGATDATPSTLASGQDAAGNVMSDGRFPYRTHASNSSTQIFGLPEMMSIGTFSRAGTTATVTTVEPHGLTSGNVVYTTTGNSNLNANAVQVTVSNANTFTYSIGSSSQTVSARQGSYRRHSAGTFSRASSTVTVSSTAHGLVTGDVILVSTSNSNLNTTSVAVTVTGADTFTYASGSSGTINATAGTWVRIGLYNVRNSTTGPAVSYSITPVEYCSDENLTNCVQVAPGATPPANYQVPAYVRFCQTQAQAVAPGAVSDATGTPQCRSKYVSSTPSGTTWTWARYGLFNRDTIQSTVNTYPNRPGRTDCTNGTCTYEQEIQNYARWFTYYRTRMQMMKTAAGRAFLPFISNPEATPVPVPDKLRVGFITINPNYTNSYDTAVRSSVVADRYLRIDTFNNAHATTWYDTFYRQIPIMGTPLREALARAGWIYAGKLATGLTSGIPATDDPVQLSCQRHFTLLTTDGYWNGNNGQDLTGAAIGNADNIDPITDAPYTQPSVDRISTGTFDGGAGSVFQTSTPTTVRQQVTCSGNNRTAFPGSAEANTTCGCSAREHRIMQRTTTTWQDVSTNNGNTTTTTRTEYAFEAITPCSTGDWAETQQAVERTQILQCDRRDDDEVVFTSGNRAGCGACQDSRRGARYVLIKEVLTGTRNATATDGSTTASSVTWNGSPSYWYSNNGGSSWVNSEPGGSSDCTTTDYSNREQSQATANVGSATTTASGTGDTLTIALSPNPSDPVVGTPTQTVQTAGGWANTLADVAMYYYRSDLRGGRDIKGNSTEAYATNAAGVNVAANNINVRAGAKNFARHQHMVTFSVGMADGNMRYQPDYETAETGDFANIKEGRSDACFWTTGVCDWPRPVNDSPSALDDLWHAAVNGRGQYYQATNPDALSLGIQKALASLNVQLAAAAASATSSPNVTETENQIFSTRYQTNTWSGQVFAQRLDPGTAAIVPEPEWWAHEKLMEQVGATSDSRNLFTFRPDGDKVKPFAWDSLNDTERAYFTDKCSPAALTQCATLNDTQRADIDAGELLVGYLRGHTGNEGTLFRDRYYDNDGQPVQTVLGDTITAKPAFVSVPNAGYSENGYAEFAAAQATARQGKSRVYVGANDGFLHAFDADDGSEAWAYTPRFLMQGLFLLADTAYSNMHRYYVDGSPETHDVYDATAGEWKTILVAGVSGGGKGYYALDITNPDAPKGLWEFCNDATLCPVSDPDLGLTYGNPVIGQRESDGRWVVVVTSGLNNVSASDGSGIGYFYVLDAITGEVLHKISTGVGDSTTPSGLMKTAGLLTSPGTARFRYVYGGDQLGNVWRLDVSKTTPTVLHLATLTDVADGTRRQPITTRPVLTRVNGNRVLYIGTGRYLGNSDLSDQGDASSIAWQQSFYAFKDRDIDENASPAVTTLYGNLRANANLVEQVLSDRGAGLRGITDHAVDWSTRDGWYIDFNPVFDNAESSPGEGVNLVDPRLILGTLVVITNAPSRNANSCSPGGRSFLYHFDYKSGSSVSTAGGVAGKSLGENITVGNAIVQTSDGNIHDIITLDDGEKLKEKVPEGAAGAGVKKFSYRVR